MKHKTYHTVNAKTLPQAIANAIAEILVREGSQFTDHKNDHPTKYGIRRLSADRAGYVGEIKDLTYNDAFKIWTLLFYFRPKLNLIFNESELIGETVLDTSGPAGTRRGVTDLQLALNSFNMVNPKTNAKIYGVDLKLDGVIGAKTQAMLRRYLEHRQHQDGEFVLATRLNCLQDAFYTALAHTNIGKRAFSFGWSKGRVYADLISGKMTGKDSVTV